MRGLLAFLYGVAAYLAGVAALLYFIGFSSNLIVPKSVDVGATVTSTGWAIFANLLLLALFGVQHSLMARQGFKRWWKRFVHPAVERSTYLVATSLALAVIFWLWQPIATPVLWRVVHGAGVAVLWTLFALCWLIIISGVAFYTVIGVTHH